MDAHSIAALAAALAKEPEKSKVPFFLVGGGLAAWAVILSAIGLSRPEFPGASVAARGVMAFSALLVAAAMVTAVAVS
jgi:hypothetical protein